jgi:hypothetical protein
MAKKKHKQKQRAPEGQVSLGAGRLEAMLACRRR